ncbi:MAG: 30S ribosomal protein S20 [Gammaproteobacteria bacterium]
MANIKSAQKRARQTVKRRTENVSLRSRLRTVIKKVLRAIESGDKAGAEAAYKEAAPVIDSMSGKNIIHKNKAARHKSHLNQQIREMQ